MFENQPMVVALICIALAIYFAVRSAEFVSTDNATALCEYIAPTMIIAIAEVPILILGEIDLSVGEVYLFSPFMVHYMADMGLTVAGGIIISLLICAVIGAINGFIVVRLRIPSFIATLGSAFAVEGIILLSSHGEQITPIGSGMLVKILGGGDWAEIIWAVCLLAVFQFRLRKTVFGLHNLAVGGNEIAARESGIPVARVKITCFVLCSLLGGLVGILDGYQIGSLDPGQSGLTIMFYGVAAAVIGGTALNGGRGTVVGAGLGVVLIGILQDGFNIIGVSAFAFDLILGLAILGAMVLNVQLGLARSGGGGSLGRLGKLLRSDRDARGGT
jgi:simple sugar transport system permease protein